MNRLSHAWEDLCELVIRPQRANYRPSHLGPTLFQLGDSIFQRTDLEIINPRGFVLQCSHFEPKHRPQAKLPCVIYLHGNCGSRLDALEAVVLLLPYNITVLAFDCSGSGHSGGDYISLGHYERQDLAAVVEYLRKQPTVSRLGLWGRSMGAVTAIMYCCRDQTAISAIVADSPFSTLVQVMVDTVRANRPWIPELATRLALRAMRRSILSKAWFDINELDTVSAARHCPVPIIFAHARGDDFVGRQHAWLVHEAYAGPKRFLEFEGDHNSERPEHFLTEVVAFFLEHLSVELSGTPPRGTAVSAAVGVASAPAPTLLSDVAPAGDLAPTDVDLGLALDLDGKGPCADHVGQSSLSEPQLDSGADPDATGEQNSSLLDTSGRASNDCVPLARAD